MIERVISGGQTGADRAGLDAALELGIEIGGCCTRDRAAEDGQIPERYPLEPLNTDSYAARTRMNIAKADVTIILHVGPVSSPGTRLTINLCKQKGKGRDWLAVDLDGADQTTIAFVRDVLADGEYKVLNVAGPRESKSPGIYQKAKAFLLAVLRAEDRP